MTTAKYVEKECVSYEDKTMDLRDKLDICVQLKTSNIVDFLLKTCEIKVHESIKKKLQPISTISIAESILSDIFTNLVKEWQSDHEFRMGLISCFIVETELNSLTDIESFQKSLN